MGKDVEPTAETSHLLATIAAYLLDSGWKLDGGSWAQPAAATGAASPTGLGLVDVVKSIFRRSYTTYVRDDIRTLVFAALIPHGWHACGKIIWPPGGRYITAAPAFTHALSLGL